MGFLGDSGLPLSPDSGFAFAPSMFLVQDWDTELVGGIMKKHSADHFAKPEEHFADHFAGPEEHSADHFAGDDDDESDDLPL